MTDKLPDKVIGIDQIRINRGLDKICNCKKQKFMIDTRNRRIYCSSCGAVIDPYDAMYELARNGERLGEQVQSLLEQRRKIKNYKPQLKVFKELERQYRRKKSKPSEMLPCCPECGDPFYFEHITRWHNRKFTKAAKKREGKPVIE